MTLRSLTFCLIAGLSAAPLMSQAVPGHGIQPAHIDAAVKPCEDFFQYANGAWLKTAAIPGEYSSWGAFMEIRERNITVLKGILEEAAAGTAWPKGSVKQKVGDFYASGMDEAAIEKAGAAPLKPFFERIAAVKDGKSLAAALARLHREGAGPAFGFGVGQDDKLSTRMIAQLGQGGLGLPDRDYYTKDDAESKALLAKYKAHVARMFTLLGDDGKTADHNAETVLALETRLAKASMTRVEQRDPNAIYHKMSRTQLAKEAPAFEWAAYFKAVGLPEAEQELLVRQPAFFKELSAMAKDVPLAQWKTYLRWHLIHGNAGELNKAFVDESFAFYGKTLQGTQELSPRWKRVQGAVDVSLGEALGQLYVEKSFSPEAKRKALDLVKNLQAALRERIQGLPWMTAPTKQKALAKLDAFMIKIGYPDHWRDYSKLDISRQPYALNTIAAAEFEFNRGLAKLGKPVDRGEWDMTPSTVNAYYNPGLNEIVFPAGILQPPFFDAQADDAVNYGGIGMVIGHEMTHGFDDEGRQYDAQGNLQDWWTPEDSKAFDARTDLVVKQYEAFEPLPGLHINGKLTLGENIADLGGLKIAYSALQRALAKTGRPAPIDGFTAEQRFFLGYAQAWHFLARPESAKMRLMTDPHSPAKFRVLGPLANLPEFYEAFGCGEGSTMVRPAAQRPAIW